MAPMPETRTPPQLIPAHPDAPGYTYGDRVKQVAKGNPDFPTFLGTVVCGPRHGDNRDALYVVWDWRQGEARRTCAAHVEHAPADAVEDPRTNLFEGQRVERDATYTPTLIGARSRPTIQRGTLVGWTAFAQPSNRALIKWDGAAEPEPCEADGFRVADVAYVAERRRRNLPAIGDRVEKSVFGQIVGGVVLDEGERSYNIPMPVYVLWDGNDEPRWVGWRDIYPRGRAAVIDRYARLCRTGMNHKLAYAAAALLWRE
jgi:hypothetical protein